ncbi:hypothetical protein BDW22DRAFT_128262 [Trametopsis cervina]|nr:hypothetical protein BDW22DRAFT_128262 [Trametopsis cervina]
MFAFQPEKMRNQHASLPKVGLYNYITLCRVAQGCVDAFHPEPRVLERLRIPACMQPILFRDYSVLPAGDKLVDSTATVHRSGPSRDSVNNLRRVWSRARGSRVLVIYVEHRSRHHLVRTSEQAITFTRIHWTVQAGLLLAYYPTCKGYTVEGYPAGE